MNRGGKKWEISTLLVVEALRRKTIVLFFCSSCKSSPTRAHQSLQELAAANLIFLAYARETAKPFPIYHYNLLYNLLCLHLELGLSLALWRREFWSFGASCSAGVFFFFSASKSSNCLKILFLSSSISYCSYDFRGFPPSADLPMHFSSPAFLAGNMQILEKWMSPASPCPGMGLHLSTFSWQGRNCGNYCSGLMWNPVSLSPTCFSREIEILGGWKENRGRLTYCRFL